MIEHDPPKECACHGTGRVVQKARGVSRTWPCSCPAGRALAVPVLVRSAEIRRSCGRAKP